MLLHILFQATHPLCAVEVLFMLKHHYMLFYVVLIFYYYIIRCLFVSIIFLCGEMTKRIFKDSCCINRETGVCGEKSCSHLQIMKNHCDFDLIINQKFQ